MVSAATVPASIYCTNDEAAAFLKLSPRTLEKLRVIGGGPKFRKLGRRVVYAMVDLESWVNDRVCTSTSDTPTLRRH
jgi:Helix-turn-helix domain